MPFYNPYMKSPDFASGGQDIMSMLMQMMMMNRMFPQTKTTESPDMGPQGMPPPMSGIQPPSGMGQQVLGGAPSGMPPTGGPGGSPMPQIPPQLMQMIMQMLNQQQQQPPTPQFGR